MESCNRPGSWRTVVTSYNVATLLDVAHACLRHKAS